MLAVGVEGRAVAAVRVRGLQDLAAGQGVEEDGAQTALRAPRVGQPLRVGREGVLGDLVGDGPVHFDRLLRVHVQVVEAQAAVAPGELLRVGRPHGGVVEGGGAGGDRQGSALPILADEVDLLLPGPVRHVGDPLPVGRPDGILLAHALAVRDVPRVAMLRGHGEHVAAGGDGHAVAARGEGVGGDAIGHAHVSRPGPPPVVGQAHRDLPGLAPARVQEVDPPAVLEHDATVAGSRPFHVELGEAGGPRARPARHVVPPQVQLPVLAVGQEVDRISDPHGLGVGARPIRDLPHLRGLEVVDPHVLGHAALVALPGAEVPEDARVGDAPSVGGEGDDPRFR